MVDFKTMLLAIAWTAGIFLAVAVPLDYFGLLQ